MESQHVGNKKRSQNSSQDNITPSILPPKEQDHSSMTKKPKLEKSSSNNQMILGSSSSSTTTTTIAKGVDLPCTILIQILARLPIKTLINFRYVCKSWKSLLTESYFYKLYSYHMPSTLIIQIKGSSLSILKQISVIESRDHTKIPINKSSLARKLRFIRTGAQPINNDFGPNFRFQVGNSCNGLVGIRDTSSGELTLVWNPMMGQFAVFPKPATTSDGNVVAGFGFCGRTGRYKVVRIFHKSLDPQFILRVEIYEMGVGVSWREIGTAPFPIPSRLPGFYTHDSLHWILEDDVRNSGLELICSFDFVEEKFKTVKPPPIYSINKKKKYHWSNLGIIGGCLSICAIDAKIFRADVQVWVMEEYGVPESWTLKLSIRDPTVNWWDPHRWIQVTNIGKDGEILMLCAHSYLLAYNLRERRFTSMEELKFPAIAVTPSFINLNDVLCEEQGTGSMKARYL